MKKNKTFFGFVLVMLSLGLVSCGSVAPFAERDAAKKSIDLAQAVEAGTYSPDEFDQAVSEYDAGQELIVEEGKSKQNDEAKIKYLEADKQAKAAYDNSVVPYVESFIQKTDEEIELAREIKTDVALSEQFDSAVSKNDQARESLNNNNYEQAKITSLEAYDIIFQARNETMELREMALDYEQEYSLLLTELKDNKAEAAIPNEYQGAEDNYDDIQSQFEEGYYVDVIELYQDGILDGENLLYLIEEKRLMALELLQQAEESIESARIKVEEAEAE